MTTGRIYTVAGHRGLRVHRDGGPASHADPGFPTAVVAARKGLLIAGNRRVRMISG